MGDDKVHLKSFPRSKAKQLNHHTTPILEDNQHDAAAIHVGNNDLLKGTPNVSVESLYNDTLKLHYVAEIVTSEKCLFQVMHKVPNLIVALAIVRGMYRMQFIALVMVQSQKGIFGLMEYILLKVTK